jgi:hypothetical protein
MKLASRFNDEVGINPSKARLGLEANLEPRELFASCCMRGLLLILYLNQC